MWSRRFELILTALFMIALATTALSGLLADYLGIPRSIYHRLSAYSLVALSLWHIALRYRQLLSRIKRAVGSGGKPVSPSERARSEPPEPSGPARLSRRSLLISGAAAVVGFIVGRWLPPGRLPSDPDSADLGLVYHQWSKPSLAGLVRQPFHWGEQPPLYKDYPLARRVALPGGLQYRGLTAEEAIERRRSVRDYSGKPLTMEQLSLLLHSAYGITEPTYPLRASPSAGALYPLEIYPVVNRVTGLASGVYHYRPADHSLDLLKEGDFRPYLLVGTGGQDMVLQAGVVFVVAAMFQRTRWKYQERAYRYVLLDAGHLGENLYLSATSMGLGACGIGAFLDDEVNRLVSINGNDEAAVYLVSIGQPA